MTNLLLLAKIVYLMVGTYTSGESKGIYTYRFDTETGYTEYVGMAEAENPSYLTFDSSGDFLYAVSEGGDKNSFAEAFSFDKERGMLTHINSRPTHGGAPCNITTDAQNKHVVTANYSGGNITVFKVDKGGGLSPASQVIGFSGKGPDTQRQEKPHLHCVKFSPDGKFLFAADLGTDRIHRFDVNPSGEGYLLDEKSLVSFPLPGGAGPRHFIFSPSGRFIYLVNELSGTVVVFGYDEGNLYPIQTEQADEKRAKGSADIVITPDGRFLYVSNRLENDGVAIFSVDPSTGKLTKTGYQTTGIHPRNLAISPGAKFLLVANRDSNSIEIYKIDHTTGKLLDSGKKIKIDMPVCSLFL